MNNSIVLPFGITRREYPALELPVGTPRSAHLCELRPSIHAFTSRIIRCLPIENSGVQKKVILVVSPLRDATLRASKKNFARQNKIALGPWGQTETFIYALIYTKQ